MPKVTFIGAGSTVFAKNILGDCLSSPQISANLELALYDIDGVRLAESLQMVETLNRNLVGGRARIKAYLGTENRKEALRGAHYVVNAIQVGGYEPSTVIDFEIPKKYGLRQTIADTLGIGGLFRALRTIPVLMDLADDILEVCPEVWFLNYSNPMAMLTMALLRRGIKTVGLCHSVQVCADHLLSSLDLPTDNLQWKIAGINHMAWLLELSRGGVDLYPEVKRRAAAKNAAALAEGGTKHDDMVRFEMLRRFGYYITESSEHNAEYTPYWIKSKYPQLVDQYNIPLDEYPRRCREQITRWAQMRDDILMDHTLTHQRSLEYGSHIIEAIETDVPYRIGGNVLNDGLITNLPSEAVVEVACLVDRNGVQPTVVGKLPAHLAALNLTNINLQIVGVEAALSRSREGIYHAAYLDPHTSAELSLGDIQLLCDDLIAAHGDWLPQYR
ncbi:MAG: alpha-glucosidase/alpha-galactosidase [Spirochaetales bacterium]